MKSLELETAFKYPFNRARAMWNILWIFVPIVGWFALFGYSVRIVQEFCQGKFKQLPKFKFGSDLKLGFFMFLKALPFAIAYGVVISIVTFVTGDALSALVNIFLAVFALPILAVNFLKKETVESFFEFKIIKFVFDNLGDYLFVILKSIALGIVFALMAIILVGIPAGTFTKNIFLADFYRRRVK